MADGSKSFYFSSSQGQNTICLLLAAWQSCGSTLFGLADEFVDGRIFIDVGLLAVVDSHGSMGRFCPGKKGKLLVRQGKVLGDKGKTCPGQGKIVGFTGGSTDNVVQFVIDGDNVMSPGKYML